MKIPKLDWMAIISGASVAGGAEPIDDGGVEKRFELNDKTASLPPPLWNKVQRRFCKRSLRQNRGPNQSAGDGGGAEDRPNAAASEAAAAAAAVVAAAAVQSVFEIGAVTPFAVLAPNDIDTGTEKSR